MCNHPTTMARKLSHVENKAMVSSSLALYDNCQLPLHLTVRIRTYRILRSQPNIWPIARIACIEQILPLIRIFKCVLVSIVAHNNS
jgi:hypothetical protein